MFIEISHNNNNTNMELCSTKKPTYSIKKLLKQLFKSRRSKENQSINAENLKNSQKMLSLESLKSLESLDNQLNADIESHCSIESSENFANERISVSCELEDCEFADINAVPVHFVRSAHGTFFWTAVSELPADNDLIEPLYCNTSNQIAVSSNCHTFQDRWAQA